MTLQRCARALATAAVLTAAVMASLAPQVAGAISSAREGVAARLLADVRTGTTPPFSDVSQPDLAMAGDAWQAGGVRVRDTDLTFSALHALCGSGILASDRNAPDPVAADFLLYNDTGGAPRVALFISATDVVLFDPARRAPRRVTLAALQPDFVPTAGTPRFADLLSQLQCRLPSRVWPGGVDDTSRSRGAIAIADAPSVAAQQQFAAGHPRDADTTWWHPLGLMAGSALALAGGIVGGAVELVLDGGRRILQILGPEGTVAVAALSAAGAVLGHEFDGRRGHRALSALVLTILLISPLGAPVLGSGLRVAAGLLRGEPADPLLRATGAGWWLRGLQQVASFAVALFTGITDSDHVAVGWVAFAVLSDVAVFPKLLLPLGMAARLVRLAPEPVLLDLSGRVADVASLRPSALAAAARSAANAARRLPGLPGELDGEAGYMSWAGGAPPARGLLRVADAGSLAWRPGAIVSDAIDNASAALDALRHATIPGGTGIRGPLERAWLALSPERRQVVTETAHRISSQLSAGGHDIAALSHLQSGSRAATTIASGGGVDTPPFPAPPRSRGSRLLRRAIAATRRKGGTGGRPEAVSPPVRRFAGPERGSLGVAGHQPPEAVADSNLYASNDPGLPTPAIDPTRSPSASRMMITPRVWRPDTLT